MSFTGMFIRDSLTPGIGEAETEFRKELEEDVLKTAEAALEYARENAPWNDRTGAARAGLDTDVSVEGDSIVWSLFHTVTYGIWLETIQNGAFAIIMPTLEQFAPQVGTDLSEGGFSGVD